MSQVYSTEPPTTGRVILSTTHGPIDINLWCNECPNTTRTFLQLCLDGYYNDSIFHCIIPDFLIQTGLPNNVITPDASVENKIDKYMNMYVKRSSLFSQVDNNPYIFERGMSRIRFNHRGQVALALPSDVPSSCETSFEYLKYKNLSRQFFITLKESPFLNDKYVLFGTVLGPTIFNALRIGRTDVHQVSGIPVDMENGPRINQVTVEFHPFDNLERTSSENIPWKCSLGAEILRINNMTKFETEIKKRKKKRKAIIDVNILSFGDELGRNVEFSVEKTLEGVNNTSTDKGMISTYDSFD